MRRTRTSSGLITTSISKPTSTFATSNPDLRPEPAPADFAGFRAACLQLDVDLTPAQFELLGRYTQLLAEWNSRINLVSRRDVGRVLTYHVIDSLAAARLVRQSARCCDIGTGAGLPGIPLAIARPDIRAVLVDSTQKKCQFLRRAVAELGIANAEVICARSEALPPLGCDVVLSRLTGPLRSTLRNIAPHATAGGLIVLYKNPGADDVPVGPLLSRLGLVRDRVLDLNLPLSGIPRRFVLLTRSA